MHFSNFISPGFHHFPFSSISSIGAKDLLKMKTLTLDFDSQFGVDKHKKPKLCSSEDTQIDILKRFVGESEDSSKTLDLFKRYRPLVKPDFDNGQRKPSLLENSLLSGLSRDLTPLGLPGDKGVKAQLTIFYDGQINVYNDVSFEKAQAIILLAGESSLAAPIVTNLPEENVKKTVHNQRNLHSICKLQADLPIARKFSLKRFLEKRRDRITSKAPYPSPETKHHDEAATGDDQKTATDNSKNNVKLQNGSLVLSPFPSRLANSL